MSHQDRVLQITLYNKARVRQGWIANPVAISVTERFLAQSTGEITVTATDPNLPKMLEAGARVTVDFGDAQFNDLFLPNTGYRMISGPLRNPRGSFLPGGTVTFQIEGDWRLTRNTVAAVVPSSPLAVSALTDAGQSWNIGAAPAFGEDSGRNGYYQWPGGAIASQIAVQTLMNDQINVLWQAVFGEKIIFNIVSGGGMGGLGVDVSSILPQVRFGTVEQYIVPLLVAGNVAMRISQERISDANTPGRIGADFWTPKTWSTVFTPESGVVRDGEWSITDAEATHIVLGGPGELSARAFYGVNDATGLSSAEHDIIQVFRDATGAPVQWPTTLDEKYRIAKYYLLRGEITSDQKAAFTKFLQSAGTDALADNAATSGVSLTLAESKGFRFTGDSVFPRGFATGDIVSVSPSTATAIKGLVFTDRINEVTVALSRDNGLTVTPVMGQRKDDPDTQLALAIQSVALSNNRRSTSQ